MLFEVRLENGFAEMQKKQIELVNILVATTQLVRNE